MPRSRNGTSPTAPLLGGRGMVLVVEDEPSLRVLIRRMLDLYRLASREAASAEDAIIMAQTAELPIDAVLTDLQLPEMTGLELAAQVQALRPGLPFVFMSGYPRETAFGSSPSDYCNAEFLQKPFTPAQLGEVMRRVIQRRTLPPNDITVTPPP
ncbi:MAG: response regulator [Gemmataceae bacterium]